MSGEGARPEPRRCSALRRDGEPCRNWSRRGPGGEHLFDPPLCKAHAPLCKARAPREVWGEGASRGGASRNKALEADLARVGTDLPAVGSGDGLVMAPDRGETLYAPFFADDEMAALEAIGRRSSLWGEIMVVRGMMRRLLAEAAANAPLKGRALERRAATLFAGSDVLSRLLQVERKLEMDPDGIPRPVAEALDEISLEWGIDL